MVAATWWKIFLWVFDSPKKQRIKYFPQIFEVEKIIKEYLGELPDSYKEKYLDLTIQRVGQDVRYALNDSKLRNLGWSPKCEFDIELKEIVKFYKENFIW